MGIPPDMDATHPYFFSVGRSPRLNDQTTDGKVYHPKRIVFRYPVVKPCAIRVVVLLLPVGEIKAKDADDDREKDRKAKKKVGFDE